MRVANCKVVCREIDETDGGQHLTASTLEHLRECPGCKSFYDDRLKLRHLVASVPPVEAPSDFEFRLRARLATERNGARPSFLFGRLSFGLPAIGFAVVVLLIGLTFALRFSSQQDATATTTSPEQPQPNVVEIKQAVSANDNGQSAKNVVDGANHKAIKRGGQTAVAASPRRTQTGTREFSTSPAPVFRRDEMVSLGPAVVFPVEASSQPLKVSLDYATGVSRTISVPALSFGSERVAGEGNSILKTSPKGIW